MSRIFSKGNTSTCTAVYLQLKDEILHLEHTPGTLLSEIETSNQFNISRTPVRDAFKRLETDGLLEVRPHIGTFVAPIHLDMVNDLLYLRLKMDYVIFSELMEHSNLDELEEAVADSLAKQREILDSDMPEADKNHAFILEDNSFHRTLYSFANHDVLFQLFVTSCAEYERMRSLINSTLPHSNEKNYAEHAKLVDVLRSKDQNALNELIEHHLCDGFAHLDEIMEMHEDYFAAPEDSQSLQLI